MRSPFPPSQQSAPTQKCSVRSYGASTVTEMATSPDIGNTCWSFCPRFRIWNSGHAALTTDFRRLLTEARCRGERQLWRRSLRKPAGQFPTPIPYHCEQISLPFKQAKARVSLSAIWAVFDLSGFSQPIRINAIRNMTPVSRSARICRFEGHRFDVVLFCQGQPMLRCPNSPSSMRQAESLTTMSSAARLT